MYSKTNANTIHGNAGNIGDDDYESSLVKASAITTVPAKKNRSHCPASGNVNDFFSLLADYTNPMLGSK
jgi:hypothetical protein